MLDLSATKRWKRPKLRKRNLVRIEESNWMLSKASLKFTRWVIIWRSKFIIGLIVDLAQLAAHIVHIARSSYSKYSSNVVLNGGHLFNTKSIELNYETTRWAIELNNPLKFAWIATRSTFLETFRNPSLVWERERERSLWSIWRIAGLSRQLRLALDGRLNAITGWVEWPNSSWNWACVCKQQVGLILMCLILKTKANEGNARKTKG